LLISVVLLSWFVAYKGTTAALRSGGWAATYALPAAPAGLLTRASFFCPFFTVSSSFQPNAPSTYCSANDSSISASSLHATTTASHTDTTDRCTGSDCCCCCCCPAELAAFCPAATARSLTLPACAASCCCVFLTCAAAGLAGATDDPMGNPCRARMACGHWNALWSAPPQLWQPVYGRGANGVYAGPPSPPPPPPPPSCGACGYCGCSCPYEGAYPCPPYCCCCSCGCIGW